MIGTLLLDRYEVVEQIGAGGMGVVYRCLDRQTGQPVAAKVMATTGHDAQEHRLRREYRALQRVHHPNVVGVVAWGLHEGRFFYVMELIDGVTLTEFESFPDAARGAESRAGVDRFLITISTVLAALDAVHSAGIVHRDIKPQNIMVDRDGVVKLMDFGLVQGVEGSMSDTVSGSLLGTVGYMSPEQVRGRRVDRRSDLYSIGVILYEFLTGQRPFTGDSAIGVLTRILNERPVAPRLHCGWIAPALEDIVLRLLNKNPEERYRSALEVAEALRRVSVAGSWVDPAEQSWSSGAYSIPRTANRMVGRESLLERLKSITERVVRGRGQLVLLSGEAGVGKSRLILELSTSFPDGGVACIRGACYENEGIYYQPFLEALAEYRRLAAIDATPRARVNLEASLRASFRHLAPEMSGESGEAEATAGRGDLSEQMKLFDLAARFLARLSRTMPLVLALEDLQWADEPSLELVRFLARNLKNERILLLCTFRTEDRAMAAAPRQLGAFLAAVQREGLTEQELKIARLDREATAEMAAALLGRESIPDQMAEAIHRNSDGNPYFITEIVKAVAEGLASGELSTSRGTYDIPLPKSAADLAERQLSRVGDEERKVLSLAALIGREFTFDLLQALSKKSEDDLLDLIDDLIRGGIVEEVPGRDLDTYRFTHAITRSVLEREVNRRKARRIHSAIAAAMEELYHDRFEEKLDEVVEDIAHHAFAAREHSKALLYALAAGQKAASSHAYETAIRHLEMAYEVFTEAPDLLSPDQSSALTLHLGEAYERTGKLAQAREIYEELLEELSTQEQRLLGADLALALARVLESQGNFTPALEILDHAQDLAAGDDERLAAVQRRRGDLASLRGDGGAALEMYLDALARAEARNSAEDIIAAMERIAKVFLQNGEPREAGKYLERAIEEARRLGDKARVAELLTADGQVHHDLFDSAGEIRCLEESVELFKELGNQLGALAPMGRLGRAYVRRGDTVKGVSFIEECLRRSRRYGAAANEAVGLRDLATVASYRGEPEIAVAHLEQSLEVALRLRHTPALFATYADLALGKMELGRYGEAEEAARSARQLAEEKRNVFWLLRAESVRAEILFASADVRAGAEQEAEDALAEAARIASGVAELLPPPHFAPLQLLKARSLRRHGDLEAALEQVTASMASLEEAELPFLRARVLSLLANVETELNRRAEASRHYSEARALFQQLGNKPRIQECSEALEKLLSSQEGK